MYIFTVPELSIFIIPLTLETDNGFGKWGFTKSMQQLQHHYCHILNSEIAKDLALRLGMGFDKKMLYNTKVIPKAAYDIDTLTDKSYHTFKYDKEKVYLYL